jgi:hypothetical protein
MTRHLAHIGHCGNRYLGELLRRQDRAIHLHVDARAHAEVIDESASVQQKPLASARQAAPGRVGMSNAVLQKPAGTAFLCVMVVHSRQKLRFITEAVVFYKLHGILIAQRHEFPGSSPREVHCATNKASQRIL